MRYFAYIRKSSKEKNRQVQSIPKQYDWIRKEAIRRGIKIDAFFEDSKSGHKLGRAGFEKMTDKIEESKEPIGIITWKISRLSRNPVDEGIIKYAFMRGKIQHIIARDREYKEGESQIIMGVDFGQATQYSIELSKDVIEGMNKKISNGYRPTKAPYGYINDTKGVKGKKKILVDDFYFTPIQKFLKMYSTGLYSVSELRDIMTHEWGVKNRSGKPFSTSTLYLILKRRFYCGQYLWKGEIKQGKHKPMITVEEYLRIQQLINGKNTFIKNKHENHYSGQIECGCCGSRITGYSKTKNNRFKGISTYHYLKCTKSKKNPCKEKNINRSKIDNQIIDLLESIYISDDVTNHVLKLVEKYTEKQEEKNVLKKGLLKKELHSLEGELEALIRKLTKGVIDDALFLKTRKNMQDEITSKNIQIKKLENENECKKMKEFFSFLNKAKNKFKNGQFIDKKYVIKTLGSNFYLEEGKLTVELHSPFLIFQKNRFHSKLKKSMVELQKNHSTKGENGVLDDDLILWSCFWEELRTSILSDTFIVYDL